MKMKITKSNNAVSEIIGTILILAISVLIFSIVYISFFSVQVAPSAPSVYIAGSVKGTNLILEHCGGESLPLETQVSIYLKDGTHNLIEIKDDDGNGNYYLPLPDQDNNKWDIAEKFTFDLTSMNNNDIYKPIDVHVIDVKSGSIIMSGEFQASLEADLEISISTLNYPPNPISINLELKNHGPSFAENIQVIFEHSGGLSIDVTNEWNIDYLDAGGIATQSYSADVSNPGNIMEYTQLGIILDGSSSIADTSWNAMIEGLALSVVDMPKNIIELTVIQSATSFPNALSWNDCTAEIVRQVITDGNCGDIAQAIREIDRTQGYSPLPYSLRILSSYMMATDGGLYPDYVADDVQIINVITDGFPNLRPLYKYPKNVDCIEIDGDLRCAISDEDLIYQDYEHPETYPYFYDYRNDLIIRLGLTEGQDQINALAVESTDGGYNLNYLRDSIVWPDGLEWTTGTEPPGNGWVRYVDPDYIDGPDGLIKESILAQVNFPIDDIICKVVIKTSDTPDPNNSNNFDSIIITPQPAP